MEFDNGRIIKDVELGSATIAVEKMWIRMIN
jgi:hypothetical protein